jgi:ATP adenylyltransferase
MQYIAGEKTGPEDFIQFGDQDSNDRANLVLLRTDLSIVILNRFPYNNGHLLVAPRRAVAEIEEMTDAELLDCQQVLAKMVTALRSLMRPQGFNIGLNLGRAAGAGLPQHLHWHIVPRWSGDVNYMTVVGDTRVIVQSLDELWLLLRKELGLAVE